MATSDATALDCTPTIPLSRDSPRDRDGETITSPCDDVRREAWGTMSEVGTRRLWIDRVDMMAPHLELLERIVDWDATLRGARDLRYARHCLLAVRAVLRSVQDVEACAAPAEETLHVTHPLIRYVDAVFSWVGGLVADLKDLAVRESTTQEPWVALRTTLAQFSMSFVTGHLEPLHRKVASVAGSPSLAPFPALRAAERALHGDVEWLNWELGGGEGD